MFAFDCVYLDPSLTGPNCFLKSTLASTFNGNGNGARSRSFHTISVVFAATFFNQNARTLTHLTHSPQNGSSSNRPNSPRLSLTLHPRYTASHSPPPSLLKLTRLGLTNSLDFSRSPPFPYLPPRARVPFTLPSPPTFPPSLPPSLSPNSLLPLSPIPVLSLRLLSPVALTRQNK